ncbi:LysR substrate-binding domain-containing protein [Effusibacillus pohliae]|uniref:LysR substrate-binding domain-containing protein n=1 Tax=Effusibacillus pohliae TaxID=232270 RepID=UPI0014613B11|nr:LysR substrate-binding domain-containing protein [Effusibacillus pohliae]
MQNLGVSMLPERVVRDETKAGSLVAHDIAQGKLTRPTLIAYPKHKQTDKELLRFVNWLVESY